MFNLTPMVKNILIINIGIFLIGSLLKLDLSHLFGVHYIFSSGFFIFQYVTYMWLHASFMHVLSNMFAVLIFGPMLERVWGSKKFLIFYLITGIGAGLLYGVADTIEKNNLSNAKEQFVDNPNPEDFYIYIHNYNRGYDMVKLGDFADQYYEHADDLSYTSQAVSIVNRMYEDMVNIPMVGASGAVFGILMAFGMLFPNTQLILLFPPIPIKAKYLVFFYGAYELYSEINRSGTDNVAHLAHLSGMLIAFVLLKYWARNGRDFY
ncbi:rhomboid family intramembrane serine protease [Reichenbachiella agarivorans]|uniref:Rhomboid family intramembrane serine protease n=1 Tax=Reichenbachiella agarivorans TaxID=2979464 RepID=A0ABY6CSG9_9BACT|nr:rhomboid family intramembrane serine protease [Reichenbachiella agarivorans]UXP32393.1 rhomboid family intramembrane serine protease [Reichenbachiella agarivorans]